MNRETNHIPDANLPDTPYKGLEPYFESDAPFFFGRESEWKIIADNLMATRLTLLYGAGGVGKSSLLRAGVAYNLMKVAKNNLAEYSAPEFAVVVFNAWQDDPLKGLIQQVEKVIKSLLSSKTFASLSLSLKLDQILEIWAERLDENEGGGELLIILDQFEEYFLYHPNEQGAGTFAAQFPRAVNRPDLPVNFLISIREDSLAKLDKFKTSIPNLFNNYLRVKHLDPKSAYDAISKPIEVYNDFSDGEPIDLDEGLVKVVIDQVSQVVKGGIGLGISKESRVELEKQIEPPYLQLVMEYLWKEEIENKHGNSLKLKTLVDLGGAKKIVSEHLNRQMKLLREEEGEASVLAVARIFQYLVTPSGSKIAYPLKDLIEPTGWTENQLRKLLYKLTSERYRLLRAISKSSEADLERYEIFHNVLAQPILDWRKQYLLDEEIHKRNLAIKQSLPPGEGILEEIVRAEEESELEREFRVKCDQLKFYSGQKDVLEFIERRTAQQPDISEEDVTNFLNKPKGDAGTFYRLETLRLLGFLEITDEGHGYGTIRYGLSPRYREYLSKTKALQTD